jgi:hypothetical protein
MSKNENSDTEPSNAAELRCKAERCLHGKEALPVRAMAETDVRALVHEFQVRQIELEMQNEELQRARALLHGGDRDTATEGRLA